MADVDQGVRVVDWLMISAVIAGPILAVQAQKLLERSQLKRSMKDGIFRSLMATRAVRVAPEHVQALNMISIAFYGNRFFGFRFQTKAEKTVCRSWRDYFDSLEIDNRDFSEEQDHRLIETRYDKFIVLLGNIAIAQNYDFEPLELRKQMYNPVHHEKLEEDGNVIRAGLVSVLSGRSPLQMEVVNLPRQPRE